MGKKNEIKAKWGGKGEIKEIESPVQKKRNGQRKCSMCPTMLEGTPCVGKWGRRPGGKGEATKGFANIQNLAVKSTEGVRSRKKEGTQGTGTRSCTLVSKKYTENFGKKKASRPKLRESQGRMEGEEKHTAQLTRKKKITKARP